MSTVVRGEIVTPDHPSDERIGKMARDAYLAGFTGRTHQTYREQLDLWVRWLNRWGVPYLEAQRSHIELHMHDMAQRNLADSTRSLRFTVIYGAYQWAVEEELIDKNPAARAKRPKHVKQPKGLGLTRTEFFDFLDAAQQADSQRLALVCVLGLNGLRASEAAGLNIEAIGNTLGHRTIAVLRKGGRRVVMPTAPLTSRALEAAIGGRTEGPLFLNELGERMNRHNVRYRVLQTLKASGVRHHVTSHDMRRAFITNLLKAGVDLREVQEAAGHADPRTTADYDRAVRGLDAHPTYILSAFIAGAA